MSEDNYGFCGWRDNSGRWCLKKAGHLLAERDRRETTGGCEFVNPLKEILALRERAETAERERDEAREAHRMQVVAISVAAQCNTRQSAAEQRIEKGNPYWTIAYGDVVAAVDREIAERSRADLAESRLARLVEKAEALRSAKREARKCVDAYARNRRNSDDPPTFESSPEEVAWSDAQQREIQAEIDLRNALDAELAAARKVGK